MDNVQAHGADLEQAPDKGDKLHTEDKILYVSIGAIVVTVLLIFIALLFLFRPYTIDLEYPTDGESRHFWQLQDGEDILATHLRAQLAVALLRYNHAASVQLAHNIWRTLGYLVGSIIALLGCMIAVRGVREPIQAEIAAEQVKAKITTGSVGAFIVLLGVLILFFTVVDRDTNTVEDEGITLAGAYPIVNFIEEEATATPIANQSGDEQSEERAIPQADIELTLTAISEEIDVQAESVPLSTRVPLTQNLTVTITSSLTATQE